MRTKSKRKTPVRGASKFRKTEITRALRSVEDAGLSACGVEVDPTTGEFRVLIGKPVEGNDNSNSFDRLLK